MNKITTVIANYNYGDYVCRAIESALLQTIPNKVVVVDDGSSDNSVEKITSQFKFDLKTYQFIEGVECDVYRSEKIDLICTKNHGASTARNVGIWYSWGDTDFYCILDSDDYALPTKYARFLGKMVDREVGVVYGDYQINRPEYSKYEYKKPYSVAGLMNECIVHSGSMIRKEHLAQVLLPGNEIYDPKLHGPASKGFIGCTEDYDLWIRLSSVCMIVHVAEKLSIVNEHGDNQSLKMTQQIFLQNAQTIQQRNG